MSQATLEVVAEVGWNMIGCLSYPMLISDIVPLDGVMDVRFGTNRMLETADPSRRRASSS
jgi:hypothetical protein